MGVMDEAVEQLSCELRDARGQIATARRIIDKQRPHGIGYYMQMIALALQDEPLDALERGQVKWASEPEWYCFVCDHKEVDEKCRNGHPRPSPS